MRLIDADALNYSTHRECAGHGEYYDIEIITKSKIDNAPTMDAVPIVHCKDCKWYNNQHLCIQLSRFGSIEPLADFYCAFGEREEE